MPPAKQTDAPNMKGRAPVPNTGNGVVRFQLFQTRGKDQLTKCTDNRSCNTSYSLERVRIKYWHIQNSPSAYPGMATDFSQSLQNDPGLVNHAPRSTTNSQSAHHATQTDELPPLKKRRRDAYNIPGPLAAQYESARRASKETVNNLTVPHPPRLLNSVDMPRGELSPSAFDASVTTP